MNAGGDTHVDFRKVGRRVYVFGGGHVAWQVGVTTVVDLVHPDLPTLDDLLAERAHLDAKIDALRAVSTNSGDHPR